MRCFHPLTVYQVSEGTPITFNMSTPNDRQLQLPCRQCIGCRIAHANQWAVRCHNEAHMSSHGNSFITLTLDDEYVGDGSLKKSHLQKFIRRLRKNHAYKKIRYYGVGEYGDYNLRPHYHALIFNHDFDRTEIQAKSDHGTCYRSAELTELWPFGFATTGEVTIKSAGYCTRYCLKKITGKGVNKPDTITGLLPYERLHWQTGEITEVIPEFSLMSLKPGIGQTFYEKYEQDFRNTDNIHIAGRVQQVPAYYDRLLERENPEQLEDIKTLRALNAERWAHDQTKARRATREVCLTARLENLKREL